MRVQSHTGLIVWQKAMLLAEIIYRHTQSFPPEERFGLTSQLRRAAVSVPANIAEGRGRGTRGEFLNQLSVARGSLKEVETLLEICARLGISASEERRTAVALADEVSRTLTTLRVRLLNKEKGPNR